MSSEDSQHWVMSGHDLIFEKIMMMIGLDSLESLHRCRQVCTAWNAMIMQNIWESPSKRNIIKMRIEKNWGWGSDTDYVLYDLHINSCMKLPDSEKLPNKEEISHFKWLGKNENGLFDFTETRRSILGSDGMTKSDFTLTNLVLSEYSVSAL